MSQLQANPDSPEISLSFSGGFCPRSLPLFHGTARPSDFDSVSMNGSFVEGKELHVHTRLTGGSRPFSVIRPTRLTVRFAAGAAAQSGLINGRVRPTPAIRCRCGTFS